MNSYANSRLHDTVLDRDESLTLPVRFTHDDIVDLFSTVCVGLYPAWLHVLLFFFSFSVSVFLSILYFVYDLIIITFNDEIRRGSGAVLG